MVDAATTTKTLYLIRHGESTFNQWRKKSIWTCSWICVRDPLIYDAKLSPRGQAQVVKLQEEMARNGLLEEIQLVSLVFLESYTSANIVWRR